ncbi:MAG: hypothetical protein K2K88_02920 [Muribaculaceae bacterium]|nr:hypothetical protein [Muribaculaceae bacterium]MDE6644449.1 hypothetical protein [Muribaculaceae bacterium]
MRNCVALCLFLLMLGITSCEKDGLQIQPINLETEGVSLKNQYNICSFWGNISSSENCLTFTVFGKNAEYGQLTEFCVGDTRYEYNEIYQFEVNNYKDNESLLSGDWGKIELINLNPYTIRIKVLKNTLLNKRVFKLTFGGGNIVSWVTITQDTNF